MLYKSSSQFSVTGFCSSSLVSLAASLGTSVRLLTLGKDVANFPIDDNPAAEVEADAALATDGGTEPTTAPIGRSVVGAGEGAGDPHPLEGPGVEGFELEAPQGDDEGEGVGVLIALRSARRPKLGVGARDARYADRTGVGIRVSIRRMS